VRRLAAETNREVAIPEGDDRNFYVRVVGTLVGQGKGLTEDAAHRAAEQDYDRRRAALAVAGVDMGHDALVERIAETLYAYHFATVVNGGRGFPPGTPLPHAATPAMRQHFQDEAKFWLAKTQDWKSATAPEEPVRGREVGTTIR
jgi:hypothetical protein